MALKETIRIALKCERHPRETGWNPLAACSACMTLKSVRHALERLRVALRAAQEEGLLVDCGRRRATRPEPVASKRASGKRADGKGGRRC